MVWSGTVALCTSTVEGVYERVSAGTDIVLVLHHRITSDYLRLIIDARQAERKV